METRGEKVIMADLTDEQIQDEMAELTNDGKIAPMYLTGAKRERWHKLDRENYRRFMESREALGWKF